MRKTAAAKLPGFGRTKSDLGYLMELLECVQISLYHRQGSETYLAIHKVFR